MAFRHEQNGTGSDLDRATSRSVCEAVGERLRQNFRPDADDLPSHLQSLLDEMQRREH